MEYNKPFLNYDQQIERLKYEHGLLIADDDFARQALINISYYDLINGYKDCFMVDDKYSNSITIEHLYSFNLFDKNIQGILLKYCIYVENKFRNVFAHCISKYGVHQDEYLAFENFVSPYDTKSRIKLQDTIREAKLVLSNASKGFIQPTSHYLANHNHVPPWILFRNIKFSTAIGLYKSLGRDDKDEICRILFQIDTDPSTHCSLLVYFLDTVRKYRNVIAHNLKFITYKSYTTSNHEALFEMFDQFFSDEDRHNGRGNGDIYGLLISIIALLGDERLITNMLFELYTAFKSPFLDDETKKLYLNTSNLPDDFTERLFEMINLYTN